VANERVRRVLKALLAACFALGFSKPALAAQGAFTVQGRIVDRQSQQSLASVSIGLAGQPTALTGSDGRFAFRRVPAGRYVLHVTGVGYAPEELTLVIFGDTTVVVELDRAPVGLDTLTVRARAVTVRGEVRDKETHIGLIDAEVSATPSQRLSTDAIGRFKLNRVPAAVPMTVSVGEFGYLPITVTIVPERDTVLRFDLEPDPVALAIIAQQKQRIAERAGEWRYRFDGVIDRPELLRSHNGPVIDVLKRILGSRLSRVQCVVVDEKPTLFGRRAPTTPRIGGTRTVSVRIDPVLLTMMPDRVEHIDMIRFGRLNEGLMVRIYTRDFVQRMTGGAESLVDLDRVREGAHVGECR